MSERKTPRKTAAEIRAYEKMVGYGLAHEKIRKVWSARVRDIGIRRSEQDATCTALFDLLMKSECEYGRLDSAWKRIAFPRMYDSDPGDFTWQCRCGDPDNHPKGVGSVEPAPV